MKSCWLFRTESPSSSSRLVCVACKDAFSNPWDLMVHVQAAHMVNIYEIGDFDGDSVLNKVSNGNNGSKLDKTNGESLSNGASSCNGSVVHPNENVSLFCSLEYFSIIMKNSYRKENYSRDGNCVEIFVFFSFVWKSKRKWGKIVTWTLPTLFCRRKWLSS